MLQLDGVHESGETDEHAGAERRAEARLLAMADEGESSGLIRGAKKICHDSMARLLDPPAPLLLARTRPQKTYIMVNMLMPTITMVVTLFLLRTILVMNAPPPPPSLVPPDRERHPSHTDTQTHMKLSIKR